MINSQQLDLPTLPAGGVSQSDIEAAQISEIAAQVFRLQAKGHRISLDIGLSGMVNLDHEVAPVVGPIPCRIRNSRPHGSGMVNGDYHIFSDHCWIKSDQDYLPSPSEVAERWLTYLHQVEEGGFLQ